MKTEGIIEFTITLQNVYWAGVTAFVFACALYIMRVFQSQPTSKHVLMQFGVFCSGLYAFVDILLCGKSLGAFAPVPTSMLAVWLLQVWGANYSPRLADWLERRVDHQEWRQE
jgi:hypothetical protein